MISLSSAFRLCGIESESIYLSAASDEYHREYYFWSDKVREMFDMQKLHVVKISPHFEEYGPDYLGMSFTIRGITAEELRKAEARAMQR